MSADPKNLLSTKDAAKLVGRSSDYIARLARDGKISAKRVGRAWAIDKDSLLAHFDIQQAHKEVQKEKLASERKQEYREAHKPHIIVREKFSYVVSKIPVEGFVSLALAATVAFGGYSLVHATGLAQLPGKVLAEVHAVAQTAHRNFERIIRSPRIVEEENYVASVAKEEEAFEFTNIFATALRSFEENAQWEVEEKTILQKENNYVVVGKSPWELYQDLGYAVLNASHATARAYTNFVIGLGYESFYTAKGIWSIAQGVSSASVDAYVAGVSTIGDVGRAIPSVYTGAVYGFVEASHEGGKIIAMLPYELGSQMIETGSVVPNTAQKVGSGVRTASPVIGEGIVDGYVGFIYGFVDTSYELANIYTAALEGAGQQIGGAYAAVRFEAPQRVWAAVIEAYDVVVEETVSSIEHAGAHLASNYMVPAVRSVGEAESKLVTETVGGTKKVAGAVEGVGNTIDAVIADAAKVAQANVATSFVDRIRSGISRLFGGGGEPVLLVNPGPAQTQVVIEEDEPVYAPTNVVQNYYATTDVNRNYVDSSITSLHAALSAEIQKLTGANRQQIVQNINTTHILNRLDNINGTVVQSGEFLDGIIRRSEITDSTFVGSSVQSDSFTGGTANFATTTISELTVTGDTNFSGTLTVGGLATTGALTAPYFTATSTFATTTFAGSFAVDTDGLVYATSTGNVGIGVLSPGAVLALQNSTSTQPIATFSDDSGSELFRFTNGGLFGIGTTSPYEALSVDGNGVFTGGITAATGTLTDLTVTNATTTNASSTNLFSTNATITNLLGTNATITAATTTNFYSSIFNAVTGAFTNFTATNATTTNATTTNLAISGLTQGSVPFVGANGLVVEDNANLFFDNTNNRLGIGTATPATSLDIYGTDALRIPVGTSAQRPSTSLAGQIRYNTDTTQYEGYNGSNWLGLGGVIDIDQDTYITAEESSDEDFLRFYTAGSERLTINNSGNVGIGTTSTYSLFAVQGSGSGRSLVVSDESDNVDFVVNGNGLVGIGTDNPSAPLNVVTDSSTPPASTQGILRFQTNTGSDDRAAKIGAVTGASGYVYFQGIRPGIANDSALVLNPIDGNVGVGDVTPSALFTVGDGDLFQVNDSGAIAAATGITSSGTITFSGLSDGVIQATSGVLSATSTISSSFIEDAYLLNTGDTATGDYTFDTDTFAIDSSNNRVGIGTSTPQSPLHIYGTGGRTALIESADTGSAQFRLKNSTTEWHFEAWNNAFNFVESGVDIWLSILEGGNVGVGDTSPAYKLTVGDGDLFGVNSSGAIAAATGITSSGTINFSGLTANRLVATDGSSNLTNTISSANLASSVSDETGTGSLVFSDSPTFTGTVNFANYDATNGTTTNATTTNLAVSSLTSGRIPFVSAGGRLVDSSSLTYDSGSTLLDLQGTLLVNNEIRFVDSLTRIFHSGGALQFRADSGTTQALLDSSGRFGVGTTSPWGQLSVEGQGSRPGFVVSDNSNNTDFIVTEGGNVGIGTTSPVSALAIGSGRISVGADIGNVANGVSVYGTGNGTAYGFQAGQASDRNITFGWIPGATAGASIGYIETYGSNNPLLLQRWGGNTGIGSTAVPVSTLDVAGGVGIGAYATVNAAPTNGLIVSGNVGIGTSSPYAKLSVVGETVSEYFTATSTSIASTFPLLSSTNATSTQLAVTSLTQNRVPYVGSGGRLIDSSNLTFNGSRLTSLVFDAQSTTATSTFAGGLTVDTSDFVVDPDGNFVGIGVISKSDHGGERLRVQTGGGNPAVVVDASGSDASVLQFGNSTTGVTGSDGFHVGIDASENAVLRNKEATDLIFYTSNSEVARIDSSGNVGIGTSTPDTTLHVYTNAANTNQGLTLQNASTAASADIYTRWVVGDETQAYALGIDNSDSDTFKLTDGTSPSSGNVLLSIDSSGALTTLSNLSSSGNVTAAFRFFSGFGTEAAPTYSFTSDSDVGLYRPTTNELGIVTGGNEAMRIDSSGNVGIGTSSPSGIDFTNVNFANGNADSRALVIQGQNDANADVGLFLRTASDNAGLNIYYNSGQGDAYIENAWNASGSDIHFRSTVFGTPKDNVTIKGTGLVGIGTTSPTDTFTVEGAGTSEIARFTDSSGATRLVLEEDGTVAFGINTPNATYYQFAAPDNTRAVVFSDPNGNFRHTFGTDSNSDPYWRSFNGTDLNFGIDSTNIVTVASTSNEYRVGVGTSTPWARFSVVNEYSGTPSFVVADVAGDTTPFLIDDAGNVGIGTTNPGTLFHLYGGGSVAATIESTSGSAAQTIGFTGAGVQRWTLGLRNDIASGLFALRDNAGNNVITAEQGGNVGIGTTDPESLLHIEGAGTQNLLIQSTNVADQTIQFGRQDNHTNWIVGRDNTDNDFKIQYDAAAGVGTLSTDAEFTFTDNGEFAIGTSSPATTLAIEDASAEIGINATSGSGALTFFEDGAERWSIRQDTTNGLNFDWGGTAGLYLQGTGSTRNVGIGTSSPRENLHIADGFSGRASHTGTAQLLLESSTHAGLTFLSPASGYNTIYFDDAVANAAYIRYQHDDNSLRFRVNGSERLTVNSSGDLTVTGDTVDIGGSCCGGANIEITDYGFVGAEDSGGSLVVGHNLRADLDGDLNTIEVANTHASAGYAGVSFGRVKGGSAFGYVQFFNTSGSVTAGDHVTTPTLTIDNAGDVGIGDATPDSILSINFADQDDGIHLIRSGWGTASGIFQYEDYAGDTTADGMAIVGPSARSVSVGVAGNDAADGFRVYTDPSNSSSPDTFAFGVFNDGEVGIGTTSPTAALGIAYTGAGDALQIYRSDVSKSAVFDWAAADFNLRIGGGSDFTISEGGEEHFRIDADGNVGIGTTDPLTPLEINTTNKLGATFTGATHGEGLRVTQTDYVAGNYVSLLEGAWDDGGGDLPNVRIGAMFDGGGSNLAFGTSNNYGSGITNLALWINSLGKISVGTTSEVAQFGVAAGATTDTYRSTIFAENSSQEANLTLSGTNTGYLNAAVTLVAEQGTGNRGLGIITYDEGSSRGWFYGRGYGGGNNDSDEFVINRRSTTGYSTDIADPDDADVDNYLTITDAGDFGVGIRAPLAKFTIEQSANSQFGGIQIGDASASDYWNVYSDTNALLFNSNTNDRVAITRTGSVGIGTTSPTDFSSLVKLAVEGNDPRILLSDNAGSPAAAWSMRSTDAKYVIRDETTGADRFGIDSSGFVAIGFADADEILQIRADASPTFRIENSDATITANDVIGAIEFETNDSTATAGIGAKIDAFAVNSFSASSQRTALRFFTTSTAADLPGVERMRIDHTGNVGIGSTTPNHLLSLEGPLYDSSFTIGSTGSTAYLEQGLWWDSGAANAWLDSNVPIILNPGGQSVAIGTTTNLRKFTVSRGVGNDNNAYFDFSDSGYPRVGTDFGSGAFIEFYDGGNGDLTIQTNFSGGDIHILPGSSGRVGINTETTLARLHVEESGTGRYITATQGGNYRFSLGVDTTTTNPFLRGENGRDLLLGVTETAAGLFVALHETGEIGIGTASTTPGATLDVGTSTDTTVFRIADSDGACTYNPESGSVTVSCSSDERLKTNISAPAESGLSYLSDFQIKDYTVIASGDTRTGVIAQEVLTTRPEMVSIGSDGYYQVEEPNIWKVAQAIQELDARTEALVSVGGKIGVGTSTPEYDVHVIGDVAATSFVNISTREAKKGIEYLDEARKEDVLEKLKTIQIAEYRYEYESDSNPLRLGLIAEEAPQEVLSVSGKGVDVYKLATFTLASVQELATRVESLEERVAALEAAGVVPGQGGVFSTSTLQSAFSELGVLIEKGFAQFDKLAFRQLIAEKDNDGQGAAGTGTIYSGNKLALVENKQIKASSKVFVTFTSPVVGSWFITDKANGSFRVTLDQAQTSDVTFDYFIVQTERDVDPTSASGVVDTEAPEVQLIGANPFYISVGTSYVEPGVVVTDNVDEDLQYELFVNGYAAEEQPLDTSVAGENILTYKVLDTAGNLTTVTRAVIVGSGASLGSTNSGTTTPETTTGTSTPDVVVEEESVVEEEVVEESLDEVAPQITLSGKAALKISVGDSFVDAGATATDDVDGDLTDSIVVSGAVDTATAGTYTLTYSVADAAGNEASVSRIVTVEAPVEEVETAPEETVVE